MNERDRMLLEGLSYYVEEMEISMPWLKMFKGHNGRLGNLAFRKNTLQFLSGPPYNDNDKNLIEKTPEVQLAVYLILNRMVETGSIKLYKYIANHLEEFSIPPRTPEPTRKEIDEGNLSRRIEYPDPLAVLDRFLKDRMIGAYINTKMEDIGLYLSVQKTYIHQIHDVIRKIFYKDKPSSTYSLTRRVKNKLKDLIHWSINDAIRVLLECIFSPSAVSDQLVNVVKRLFDALDKNEDITQDLQQLRMLCGKRIQVRTVKNWKEALDNALNILMEERKGELPKEIPSSTTLSIYGEGVDKEIKDIMEEDVKPLYPGNLNQEQEDGDEEESYI